MSLTFYNNNIDSKYIIINIKLLFNELTPINYKFIYFNIILNWLKVTLDKYLLIYNWIVFIQNLNYNKIRIFLFTNDDNYPNMDINNLIYITNNFKHINNTINIKTLEQLFDENELKIIINQEFQIIKNSLSSSTSSNEDSENTNKIQNNIINDYYNEYTIINNLEDNENSILNIKINSIEQESNLIGLGLSGVNKITFISELNKLYSLQFSNIYYHKKHNIYNNIILKKIKENNKFYWVEYNKSNDLNNTEIDIIKSIIN